MVGAEWLRDGKMPGQEGGKGGPDSERSDGALPVGEGLGGGGESGAAPFRGGRGGPERCCGLRGAVQGGG